MIGSNFFLTHQLPARQPPFLCQQSAMGYIYLYIYIYMVSACRLVQLQNSSSDIVKDLRSETPHPENSICWGCARSKIRFQKQYNKQLYANLAQLGQLDIPSKQDGKETVWNSDGSGNNYYACTFGALLACGFAQFSNVCRSHLRNMECRACLQLREMAILIWIWNGMCDCSAKEEARIYVWKTSNITAKTKIRKILTGSLQNFRKLRKS